MKTKTVVVHDGLELNEQRVDDARWEEIMEYCQPRAAQILGDGKDMGRQGADAGEALAFFVSQLAYTESKMYSRLYLPMQFRELLPVSNEAGEWADSVRYEKDDGVGVGDFVGTKSDDYPEVDVEYDEKVTPIKAAGIAYSYSQHELRQTAYLRRPLNERRMVKAFEACERHLNRVGLYGDARVGFLGLFNQTACPQDIAPLGDWDDTSTTAEDILGDINWLINSIWENTMFNDMVTDIRVPVKAWNRLVSTARTTQSDTTLLQFLLKNNVAMATRNQPLTIGPAWKLDVAGAATKGGAVSGANSRVVAYVKHPDRLIYHVPMPLRFLAPQYINARVKIVGEYRVGGVEVRYPMSMFYMDNVLVAG
jgi:hypothetical protein